MDMLTKWLKENTALGKDIVDDMDALCHDFLKGTKLAEEVQVEAKQTKMDPIAEFFACMGMFAKAEAIQLKAGKAKNKRMVITCTNCHKDFMPYIVTVEGYVRCTNCCNEQLPF